MSRNDQIGQVISLYESRAGQYDNSWHPDFTKRFVSFLNIRPGQHVLDLACGTGLLSFLEADAVGPSGQVIGVDVTPGMLEKAIHKKAEGGDRYSCLTFIGGDVSDLNKIEQLKGKTFDVISVVSALTWFPHTETIIEHWSEYLVMSPLEFDVDIELMFTIREIVHLYDVSSKSLAKYLPLPEILRHVNSIYTLETSTNRTMHWSRKPGGIIAMDMPHPRNIVSGIVLERVAQRLNLPFPSNRLWCRGESALQKVLESAGLEVEQVVTVNNQAGYGRRSYDVDQWHDFFVETTHVRDIAKTFGADKMQEKAKSLYKDEWEKLTIDGKVEEVDAVFVGIGRKRADGGRWIPKAVGDQVIFLGGCRCGMVKYTSSAPPSDITICHCRACQQLSGSGYLAFSDVPIEALQFTQASTRKTLKLSNVAERTFCSDCGTPISMAYSFSLDHISLTMATMDLDSLSVRAPRINRHIYLREKAPWVMVVTADDSIERWGTWEKAHLLV